MEFAKLITITGLSKFLPYTGDTLLEIGTGQRKF
jgi:hypothetical protein